MACARGVEHVYCAWVVRVFAEMPHWLRDNHTYNGESEESLPFEKVVPVMSSSHEKMVPVMPSPREKMVPSRAPSSTNVGNAMVTNASTTVSNIMNVNNFHFVGIGFRTYVHSVSNVMGSFELCSQCVERYWFV